MKATNKAQRPTDKPRGRTVGRVALSASKHLVLIATMGALLVIGKLALSFVPNIEVVTTLVIVFAYVFRWDALGATLLFCLLDCVIYPPSLDVMISYLIYWNLLALLTVVLRLCRVRADAAYWLLGLVMTLFFGVLTSLVYALLFGVDFFAWYAAGIVFYVLQLVSTLVFMLVGFRPLVRALQKVKAKSHL